MKHWITAFLFLVLPAITYAQRFGGTPPEVKWRQINTDTARIIYPAGLDSQAQRVATAVHWQAKTGPGQLGSRLKKINIVLQNQTVISNGYVGLGPYRSEFYLNPPVNNFDQGSISWIDQLAIHEYRHVQQFNNFNHGISRLMGTLFGEEGYALAINASIPDWFYEGDAVQHETRLTPQGRGRMPLFVNAYPTLWREGREYSWMKMRNGSLKDYVPGHYHLGYLLTNYGYEKYGEVFWKNVTRDASAFKGIFYPFQKAIKKYTGKSYREFREEALNYYRNPREKKLQESQGEKQYLFPVNKQYVTNYMFPFFLGTDSMLYLKTTYRHRPAFYIYDGKTERRIRVRDIAVDDQYAYRNGRIVYAAYENDPRWRWRDYSVIRVLDIYTGEQKKLTKKSRYFSPDISLSGNRIAAVEMGEDGTSTIHILDRRSGNIEKIFREPGIRVYADPKFLNEDSLITTARYNDGRMAFEIIDISSGLHTTISNPGYTVIGNPSISGSKVYFTASYKGSDNIFVLDLHDSSVRKVSEGPEGKYFVNAAANGSLAWSGFTADGYQLQKMDAEALRDIPVNFDEQLEMFETFPVAGDSVKMMNRLTPRQFNTSGYAKGTGLINFHSWRPYYEDPEFSFSIYGQNILNTLETELYYLHNQNDRTNAIGFNTVYGAWFPYLSAGIQYTFDRRQLVDEKTRTWNQLDARLGLSLPLSFTMGRTSSNFSAGTDYVFRHDQITNNDSTDFQNSNFSYLAHRISFSQQVQSAVQHIFPRLGYIANLQYRHAINRFSSWQLLSSASVYLPGLAQTHNIVLSGSFQQRDTVNILFGNRFAYSRGFNEVYPSRMWRASVNYHLPLVYPDWGFANILYFQRLRANGFFDLTRLYSNNKSIRRDQRSAGLEIFADTKWWNQYELSFGFRISRLLDPDLFTGVRETVFEFILPVSIFPK